MNYSKVTHVFSLSLLITLLMPVALSAQQIPGQQDQPVKEDFSDAEIEQFVAINMDMMPIQQAAEAKMIDAIESAGLEIERFQQLFQAQQLGNITDASEDPQEIAKFNEAGQQIMKVQEEANQEIQQMILDADMQVQTFQEISTAYQQSPVVKAKVDQILEKME
ncbi:DUF4168 domain-containing protein [Lunatimonas lonarensis]|nr:DUF4168 domain-containing protein [Lunatimonas lonarensis]